MPSSPDRIAEELRHLGEVTQRLRRECPWDREQDERSIVSHTIEESYELADAAIAGDDAKLLDELGDVLFQVFFLALLLEERDAGDLGGVASAIREKLVRRHPHVFGDVVAETSGEVRENWDRIKREQEGRDAVFADVPENLPALLHARKLQRRAASRGHDLPDPLDPVEKLGEGTRELERLAGEGASGGPGAEMSEREAVERAVGDVLFAAVDIARKLAVDPEMALRGASARFREAVEHESR